jgi:hypothetical protein
MKLISRVAWILSAALLLVTAAWLTYSTVVGRMTQPATFVAAHILTFSAAGIFLLIRRNLGRFLAAFTFIYVVVDIVRHGDSPRWFEGTVIALLLSLAYLNLFNKTYRQSFR